MSDQLAIFALGDLSVLLDGQPLMESMLRQAAELLVYLVRHPGPHSLQTLGKMWRSRCVDEGLTAPLDMVLRALQDTVGAFVDVSPDSVSLTLSSAVYLDAADFEERLAIALPQKTIDKVQNLEQAADLRNWAPCWKDHIKVTDPSWADSFMLDSRVAWVTRMAVPPIVTEPIEQALTLFRPGFMGGRYGVYGDYADWQWMEHDRMRQLAESALDTLVIFHLHCGEYDAGLETVQRVLDFDPMRWKTHHQRILLLAQAGRRDEALAAYDTLCKLMASIVGM